VRERRKLDRERKRTEEKEENEVTGESREVKPTERWSKGGILGAKKRRNG
jgi:hypothetical protein